MTEIRKRGSNGCTEPLVVPVEDLAPLLEQFCAEWRSERNPDKDRCTFGFAEPGKGWRRGNTAMVCGPVDWLSEKSGVNERHINRLKARDANFVTLPVADALVSAMDMPNAWYDGRLRLMPNPQLSEKTWRRILTERLSEGGLQSTA